MRLLEFDGDRQQVSSRVDFHQSVMLRKVLSALGRSLLAPAVSSQQFPGHRRQFAE
jgi:hypothetical protein